MMSCPILLFVEEEIRGKGLERIWECRTKIGQKDA